MAEVAAEIGFANGGHFALAFKRAIYAQCLLPNCPLVGNQVPVEHRGVLVV